MQVFSASPPFQDGSPTRPILEGGHPALTASCCGSPFGNSSDSHCERNNIPVFPEGRVPRGWTCGPPGCLYDGGDHDLPAGLGRRSFRRGSGLGRCQCPRPARTLGCTLLTPGTRSGSTPAKGAYPLSATLLTRGSDAGAPVHRYRGAWAVSHWLKTAASRVRLWVSLKNVCRCHILRCRTKRKILIMSPRGWRSCQK